MPKLRAVPFPRQKVTQRSSHGLISYTNPVTSGLTGAGFFSPFTIIRFLRVFPVSQGLSPRF
jgi:hypothetical protein